MILKKVCMLGAFAVGKTSLVSRFVYSIFSHRYQTTVGVKIDKKSLQIDGQDANLILWDIHGEDDFQKVRKSYLRGAAGYFLVVDGTRRETLDTAHSLHQLANDTIGEVPFIVVLNKSDLAQQWEVRDDDLREFRERKCELIRTSAKTGMGVEEIFRSLTKKMLSSNSSSENPIF